MTTDLRMKAAKEAAAKVNAMLVATGQLRPSDLSKGRAKPGKSSDLFVEEVVINDAPMSARNFLTRSFTQEEISKMSGASVSTRGRYMTKEEIEQNTSSNDRPLYLHIQGVNQQDVKVAVGRIMHLIMEHTHRKTSSHHKPKSHNRSNSVPNSGFGHQGDQTSPRLEANNAEPVLEAPVFPQNRLREKVFLPINVNLNPVEVRIRLVGEYSSNLKYIQDETRASIFMRGTGSGFPEPSTGMEAQEPLHFYLEHHNQEQFIQAKELVVDLAQTILSQIHREQPPNQVPHLPQAAFQPGIQQNSSGQMTLNGTEVMPLQPGMPPQIHPTNQVVVSAVGQQQVPPGLIPPQLAINPLQLQQGSSPLIISQVPTASSIPGQPLAEIPPTHVVPGTQLVQISVPSSGGGPNLVSQQLVQTSVGPQLVQLPHGTQIISTPEGPRLVSLAPVSTASTAFITQSVHTSVADPHASIGMALSQPVTHPVPPPQIQQPVPQPVPPVSGAAGFGQEPYIFEGDQPKFSTAPVLVNPSSTTFAYLPQGSLEQDAAAAPSSVALEGSQAHWNPSSNSIVFSHVNIPSSQELPVIQGSQTQVTFTHPPNVTNPSGAFQNPNTPSFPQTLPAVTVTQRRPPTSDWNLDNVHRASTSINDFLQNSGLLEHYGEGQPFKKGDTPLPASEGNLLPTENDTQRAPGRGTPYLWAQYPQRETEHTFSPRGQAFEIKDQQQMSGYIRGEGGAQQDERKSLNPGEHLSKHLTPQGLGLPLRKTSSPGEFSTDPKRRRSFEPTGEFHGPNRIMRREPGNFSSSRMMPMKDSSTFSSFRSSTQDFSGPPFGFPNVMDNHNHPLKQDDSNSKLHGTPSNFTPPPMDKGRNSWRGWNQTEGPPPLHRFSPLSQLPGSQINTGFGGPRAKLYDSPWESGIPPGISQRPRFREPFVRRRKF